MKITETLRYDKPEASLVSASSRLEALPFRLQWYFAGLSLDVGNGWAGSTAVWAVELLGGARAACRS